MKKKKTSVFKTHGRLYNDAVERERTYLYATSTFLFNLPEQHIPLRFVFEAVAKSESFFLCIVVRQNLVTRGAG